MKHKSALAVVVEDVYIRSHIVWLRGVQVMLDFDLAKIYGYSTKDFNRQVKNNIDKFDADFMFQLTREEVANLRCKNSTSYGEKVLETMVYHSLFDKMLQNFNLMLK